MVVMEVHHNQSENLAQVQTGDHLFEGLLTRTRRVLVDDNIILGARENFVLIIKSTPLAVDGHRRIRRQLHVGKFWNGAKVLHVRSIAARAKDTADLHLRVSICRRDESTSRIVDQRGNLDRNSLEYLVSITAQCFILDRVWLTRACKAASNIGTTLCPSTPLMSKPLVHRWRTPSSI